MSTLTAASVIEAPALKPRNGAALVWASLRAAGIDTVFGYPGGAVIPLYDALEGSGIRHILTRHEQGAAFAAEGYARACGRPGVAIATSGPGATNLLTGLADAKMDSVPLLCITGQVRSALLGTDAFQETDVFGATLPLTKWSHLVRSAEEIPRVVARALRLAQSGRPGPVLIDIPVDVLKATVSGEPMTFREEPAPGAPTSSFPATAVAALLREARRPVILVGAGVKLSGAVDAVRELLDRLQIPATATVHGLGVIPAGRAYGLGMAGMHGTRAANIALHETDLLLVLGARLDDRVTGDPSRFAPEARIVHFEIDPAQLDRVRKGELAVVGDLAATVPEFLRSLRAKPAPDFSAWRETACGPARAELAAGGTALPALRLLDRIYARFPSDGIVVADVGQHQMWAAQRFRADAPFGFMTSGGLGAMGFALPAAIGAQLARPQAAVLCISGDGGFQMNVQELATIRRCSAPLKLLVLDNKYLGMVRQWQQLFYQRNYAETDLSDNPDFVALAAAYGIPGERLGVDPGAPGGLPAATDEVLDRFLGRPGPALLVFECPPEANVFPMVPSGAALSEMLLCEEEN
ncbi:MAG TPA: biosynthetic-type acetolactate synthase large subunit [Terriglobales bacterium]|nr:biosynthetic-type acetolactate synthase large subunit [Terriglobales bacterium]